MTSSFFLLFFLFFFPLEIPLAVTLWDSLRPHIWTSGQNELKLLLLALPENQHRRDERSQSHSDVFLAASVPPCAVIVVRQRPEAVAPLAVVGRLAARRALDQRHLVGRSPLLRPVRAGPITGPLAVIEQVASMGVLLHAEELVLRVGEADAQRHAAVRDGDVLLHPDLPRPLRSTLITIEDIEEGDEVRPAHDVCGVKPPAVAPTRVDGEGGVFTDGVRVVVVVTLPRVVVVVEDEVAGEEEDLGADLAALTHPLAVQAHGEVGPRRQDGRVELVRAVDDATGDAAVVVVLEVKREGQSLGAAAAAAAACDHRIHRWDSCGVSGCRKDSWVLVDSELEAFTL
ncbi:hypothetical protein INR49_017745 [Caranx melampygus]|nr:hypothetical protein INR49_017745 [Caranx melampygus]